MIPDPRTMIGRECCGRQIKRIGNEFFIHVPATWLKVSFCPTCGVAIDRAVFECPMCNHLLFGSCETESIPCPVHNCNGTAVKR